MPSCFSGFKNTVRSSIFSDCENAWHMSLKKATYSGKLGARANLTLYVNLFTVGTCVAIPTDPSSA